MGSGLSYSVNIAGGTCGLAVTLEMACRQAHHPVLCVECQNVKIFKGLSNTKNTVFNVKKLLNVGVGLTLRRKGGKN
jgi:hypothetical protein